MLLQTAFVAVYPNSSLNTPSVAIAASRQAACRCRFGSSSQFFAEGKALTGGCGVQPGFRSREAGRFFWFMGVPSGSYPVLCTGSRFGPIRRPAASSLFCFACGALRVTVSTFGGPSVNAELRPWEAGPLAWLRLV